MPGTYELDVRRRRLLRRRRVDRSLSRRRSRSLRDRTDRRTRARGTARHPVVVHHVPGELTVMVDARLFVIDDVNAMDQDGVRRRVRRGPRSVATPGGCGLDPPSVRRSRRPRRGVRRCRRRTRPIGITDAAQRPPDARRPRPDGRRLGGASRRAPASKHCGAQRRERLAADNAEYAERFGFPFILAVSGLTTARHRRGDGAPAPTTRPTSNSPRRSPR